MAKQLLLFHCCHLPNILWWSQTAVTLPIPSHVPFLKIYQAEMEQSVCTFVVVDRIPLVAAVQFSYASHKYASQHGRHLSWHCSAFGGVVASTGRGIMSLVDLLHRYPPYQ